MKAAGGFQGGLDGVSRGCLVSRPISPGTTQFSLQPVPTPGVTIVTEGESGVGSSDHRDPETSHRDPEPDQHSGEPNRRQFLQSVGAGGYAVGVATALDLGVGSGRDEVSITYALARENPAEPTVADDADPATGEDVSNLEPRTTTVPGEWYDAVELAFRLREELVEKYLDAIVDLFVVPGDIQEGAASLSATVTAADVRESVLDHGRGLDLGVDVEVIEEFSPEDEDGTDPWDARRVANIDAGVPGGVLCTSGDGYGTLTPVMYDSETGSRWFGTSNHVYGAQGTKTDEHAEEPLYVPDEADIPHEVGAVERGYPGEDVVRVRPAEGYRPAPRIDGVPPSVVAGQFTRYGLALLAARGRKLEKIGAFSGYTTGEIQGIDGITCYAGQVCKDGQLKWGDREVVTSGDSGSVNYHPDLENPNEGVLVGGINNARTWWPGQSYVWGVAAYRITEQYGYHF